MHTTRSGSRPGEFRWHLWAKTPERPLCWLLGHRPQLEVVEPSYGGRPVTDDNVWLKIDCSRCGWRFRQSWPELPLKMPSRSDRETYEAVDAARRELHRARLEVARRDPAGFLTSIARRPEGEGHGTWDRPDFEASVDAIWHPTYGTARDHKAWHQGWGFRFHLGTEHSESPLHLNLHGHWWSLYLSTSAGRRLARRIGGGHKRNLTLQTYNGWLAWELWHDDDGGSDDHHRCDLWRRPRLWPWSAGREKYRPWLCLRNGHVDLNPAEALWGSPKPTRELLAEATIRVVVGDFPGDAYLVDLKMERETWAREHGPRAGVPVDVSIAWEWDARSVGGIPTRNDSWKGDNTYSSYQRLAEPPPPGVHWTTHLAGLIVEQVRRDRERRGYVPPKANLSVVD